MTKVFVVDDESQRQQKEAAKTFFAEVDKAIFRKTRVAFDCEGVDLSRVGSLEIVSLCFEDESSPNSAKAVYLLDLGGSGASDQREERVAALKKLFECKNVVKVIHDCRIDCDALYHKWGIDLQNAHDTSCYHSLISGTESNLNDTLAYHGLSTNAARDNNVYKANPAFWATRPLTLRMKTWASRDVAKLLPLATKQISVLSEAQKQKAATLSSNATRFLVDMNLERGLRCMVSIGLFIGRKGCNLKSLERRTGTRITNRSQDEWLVYYQNRHSLLQVKQAMGY